MYSDIPQKKTNGGNLYRPLARDHDPLMLLYLVLLEEGNYFFSVRFSFAFKRSNKPLTLFYYLNSRRRILLLAPEQFSPLQVILFFPNCIFRWRQVLMLSADP